MKEEFPIDYTFVKIANEHAQGYDKEHNTELNEAYNNNRMTNAKNIEISKSNIIEKTMDIIKHNKKRILAAVVISGIAAIGAAHMHAEDLLYKEAVEAEVIPKGTSFRDDSISGMIISYEDEFGTRQTLGADEFTKIAIGDGLEKGFSIDQIAVALDACGVCDARDIEGSSLVGRIGAELTAIAGEKSISEGRTR